MYILFYYNILRVLFNRLGRTIAHCPHLIIDLRCLFFRNLTFFFNLIDRCAYSRRTRHTGNNSCRPKLYRYIYIYFLIIIIILNYVGNYYDVICIPVSNITVDYILNYAIKKRRLIITKTEKTKCYITKNFVFFKGNKDYCCYFVFRTLFIIYLNIKL